VQPTQTQSAGQSSGDPRPVLSVRGVSKSYGAVAALRDVRIDLYAGEAHALAGENGAGKSTLVKPSLGCTGPTRARSCSTGNRCT